MLLVYNKHGEVWVSWDALVNFFTKQGSATIKPYYDLYLKCKTTDMVMDDIISTDGSIIPKEAEKYILFKDIPQAISEALNISSPELQEYILKCSGVLLNSIKAHQDKYRINGHNGAYCGFL